MTDENKKEKKYEQGTVVEIFKDTPGHKDGDVAVVIDKERFKDNYLVASTRWLEKCDSNIELLMKHHSKWVRSVDFRPITFEKLTKKDIKIQKYLTRVKFFAIVSLIANAILAGTLIFGS